MVTRAISKKAIALSLVFFAEIFISLSERSMSLDIESGVAGNAVSHRLNNNISSYPQVAEAEQEIHEFLEKWDVVGASVAIAKNERLIYAKGFGYADREKGIEVEPRNLFRVASVSKLITAVAVMQLMEEGKLNLKDHVFGENGILDDPSFLNIRDPRVKDITIYHLLTHAAGWDKYSGDPVFMPYAIKREMDADLPIDLETTIRYTLSKRTLDFDPGSRSSYSNFGYAVLGKVIERLTRMDYENYVNSRVLNPIGIYDMHLGHAMPGKRYSNEVKYYSNSRYHTAYSSYEYRKKVPSYYGGNNLKVLGAAGAWIASPAELLKLLVHINGRNGKRDILNDTTLHQMTHTPPGFKPIGWVSTTYNGIWKRSGTLSGTSALMKKGRNGFSWVMVLNTSNDQGHEFTYEIDEMMSSFIDRVDQWPGHDLFHYNPPRPLYTYTKDGNNPY
ncbi:MAG: beta-lactamase family protein [Bacteroidales bacterium]|nr:beta-lactamase family protein [Bacteroidales bacterium]